MRSLPAIGIESISIFAMPPVAYVELMAALGCEGIGLCLKPITANPHNYPGWSLADDPALRRETVAAMAANGVRPIAADGLFLTSDDDPAALARDLDLLAELGVPLLNAVTFERDMDRNIVQFGRFAELAAARGMRTAVEFVPSIGVRSLAQALELVRGVGRKDFGVTIDPMHFFRSGATVADLADVAPHEIAHVQICDVPLISPFEKYGREAMEGRLAPGEGELPLDDLVAALPPMAAVGIEVPNLAQAEAGVGPLERLAPVVAATRALLTRSAKPRAETGAA